MDELERPEVVIPKDILTKCVLGIVAVGLTAVAAKFLWDKFGKKATDETVDIPGGPDVLEGKTVYFNGQERTGIMDKNLVPKEDTDIHKIALNTDKPALEQLAYDKIAAAYGEKIVQERFGVPFDLKEEPEEEEESVDIPEEDVGADNGRFEYGNNLAKPEEYETRVGTYFVVSDILAGFNDDLFDVNAKDYIGEEGENTLHQMKRRNDPAYYVIDRDREIFYEILINRLDTYEDGYLEWIRAGHRRM